MFNNQERLENLAERIADQIEPDETSLLEAFYDEGFLKSNGFTKENALTMYLPNSYDVFWDASPEVFRDLMLKNYQIFYF